MGFDHADIAALSNGMGSANGVDRKRIPWMFYQYRVTDDPPNRTTYEFFPQRGCGDVSGYYQYSYENPGRDRSHHLRSDQSLPTGIHGLGGPKQIHAHLIGDLLVVRLHGVLTAPEQQMVKSLPAEKGRDLLKQVRAHLIETARPVMEAIIHEVTGIQVFSLHHDISTVTGEEVVLFTLAEPPYCRQPKKR